MLALVYCCLLVSACLFCWMLVGIVCVLLDFYLIYVCLCWAIAFWFLFVYYLCLMVCFVTLLVPMWLLRCYLLMLVVYCCLFIYCVCRWVLFYDWLLVWWLVLLFRFGVVFWGLLCCPWLVCCLFVCYFLDWLAVYCWCLLCGLSLFGCLVFEFVWYLLLLFCVIDCCLNFVSVAACFCGGLQLIACFLLSALIAVVQMCVFVMVGLFVLIVLLWFVCCIAYMIG